MTTPPAAHLPEATTTPLSAADSKAAAEAFSEELKRMTAQAMADSAQLVKTAPPAPQANKS